MKDVQKQKHLLNTANSKYEGSAEMDSIQMTPRTYGKKAKSGLKKNSRFRTPYSRAALKMAFLVYDPENTGFVETAVCQ